MIRITGSFFSRLFNLPNDIAAIWRNLGEHPASGQRACTTPHRAPSGSGRPRGATGEDCTIEVVVWP